MMLRQLPFLLLLVLAAGHIHAFPLFAIKGVVDARDRNLNLERVSLGGEWYFFENQLRLQEELHSGEATLVDFPGAWNDTRLSKDGVGYGTYYLRVLVPADIKKLALEIPQIYSSYSLWINDRLLATNGAVGLSADTTTPQWMPQTVSFDNEGDTVRLVLQVANFHHYKGGVKDPLYLGSSELLQHHRSVSVTSNLIESGLLALLTISFFIVYLAKGHKKVILYFALLCLTWSVRVGFSNQYVFIRYLPDFNWYAMIRIEYITLFLTMIWAILFLSRVFPKEEYRILKYVLVVGNVFLISYAILTPPIVFTEWIPAYIALCGIVLMYGIVLVLRAWVNQRAGSSYLTISILLAIFVFGFDVFSYEGLSAYNPLIFSIGYSLIFLLMGVVLLVHIGTIGTGNQSSSKLTYKDFYKGQ